MIAVYDNVDAIDWSGLPNSFVVKVSMGCGFNIIVPDKSCFDRSFVEKKLKKWMKSKPYLDYAEMQYKGVKPHIIIEKYLKPKHGVLPEDYKFYCYDGEVPYVMVCTDREKGGRISKWYFNDKWELQMMTEDALKHGSTGKIPKPEGIEKAFSYAQILSKGFPFVRVDLYIVNGAIYFGELTFTPVAGLDYKRPEETDKLLGSFVKI